MGGKIDCYIDIISWYSYVGFADLLANREKLAAHGVEVEFHPIFLGGIMGQTGNQPPWIVPTKGKYFAKDSARAAARVGKPTMAFPDNFIVMARKPITPLRALHYIKQHYPASTFISTFHFLFHKFWTPPHANVSDSSVLAALLLECPEGFDGHEHEKNTKNESARKMFTNDQVKEIIEGTERDEVKELLKKAGGEAIGKGAFGAPWLWVVDDKGRAEAFFGSDRFGYVYQHLGVPHTDVEILPKL